MKLFDIETNGLLPTVTKVHCLVIKDRVTGKKYRCIPVGFPMKADMTIEEGLELLKEGPIGGHNVIKYDLPVLTKLYPDFTYDKAQVFDTLVATRLIYTNLKDIDSGLLKKQRIPGALFGSHKLEAWGYRLGLQKGEYVAEFKARMGDAYVEGSEWWELSPEMLDYCDLDVEVTDALFSKIEAKEYSPLALEIEHATAWLMAQQERNGFPFDAPKAAVLYAKLAQRRGELERELKETFRFWFAPDGPVRKPIKRRKVWIETPLGLDKRRIKKKGQPAYFETGYYEYYEPDAHYTKIKVVEFNPASRDHIADRLTKLYGWEPEVFTDGGKPKVDDEVMAKLDYPTAPLITEYLMIAKRISQLAEGDQAWLKVEQNGFIYGSVNPNGAVTGRATHAYPNVGQVPAVGAPYGYECRELFGVETIRHMWPEAVQVGADASGLELRCLAHFMARYDAGKYGEILLNGDIHWANVQSMGLTDDDRDESNKLHKVYRDGGKTFIYGFLYGAGDLKAGRIVFGLLMSAKALGLPYKHIADVFFGGKENPTEDELKAAGKKLKRTFLKKTPALRRLIEAVKEAAKRGYLTGLDKRKLHVRSSHAALNTLLQSAGAIICKKWLLLLEEELQARGYKHGWDGDYAFMAWVHDEVQIACRTPEIAEVVAQVATECVTKAGEFFNFRCPLAGEAKIGSNWAETH